MPKEQTMRTMKLRTSFTSTTHPEKCEEAFKSNSKIDQMTQDREARIKKMVDDEVKYKFKEKAFKENNK